MDLVDLAAGTEELDLKECRRLLGEEHIGRLAVVVNGRPEVFPVNYGLDGDGIVFRTNRGRKLLGLAGEVAFEVDRFDPLQHGGWSVVVHGRAEDITKFDGPRLREQAEMPWAGPKDILVRITPALVTGRRVRSAQAAPPIR